MLIDQCAIDQIYMEWEMLSIVYIYIYIYIWNRECNIGKQGIGNVDRVGQPRQIYS